MDADGGKHGRWSVVKYYEVRIFEHLAERIVVRSLREIRQQPPLGAPGVAIDAFAIEQDGNICKQLDGVVVKISGLFGGKECTLE